MSTFDSRSDWANYAVISGLIPGSLFFMAILLAIAGIYYNTLYISGFLTGVSLIFVLSLASGLAPTYCIWKDMRTRQNGVGYREFLHVYALCSISGFVYIFVYLYGVSTSDTEVGEIFNVGEFDLSKILPSQKSSKIAWAIILFSAIGGPAVMAFTAMIVGLILFIYQSDGRSPAAEKLGGDRSWSYGRTLIHKMLGGKGKK